MNNGFITLALSFLFLSLGCAKSNSTTGTASLTLVNAVAGSGALITNFTGSEGSKVASPFEWYNTALQVSYGKGAEISSYGGVIALALRTVSDTVISIWSGQVDLRIGTIHTLFVTGIDSAHLDTLFTEDNPPYHSSTDSSLGIRFANLSQESSPVIVDLQGLSDTLVQNLPYKGITFFLNLPANQSVAKYVFECRDAASRTLLSTFTMTGVSNGTGNNTATNLYRFRNFTLTLGGVPGSSSAPQKLFLVNNY